MLQSISDNNRYYVRLTKNLSDRLKQHNSGNSKYSKTYKPWELITAIAFCSKTRAMAFEKYLKSHSGRAFAKKHF
jgi:predicted GIY-YIG superfamily endonuclease